MVEDWPKVLTFVNNYTATSKYVAIFFRRSSTRFMYGVCCCTAHTPTRDNWRTQSVCVRHVVGSETTGT